MPAAGSLIEDGIDFAGAGPDIQPPPQLESIPAMSRKLILQEFLPYLLNRAGLRIGVMFSREIEHLGITLPMWRVMIELWHNGDHRLGELAERTSIDISTLSRLLVTMQRRQLIVRRRSGQDGRALSLTLTDKGLELTEQIAPFATAKETIATRGMKAGDVKKLCALLKQVYDNLEAPRHEPGSESQPRKKSATKPAKKKRAAASA
jgi:DNA-binding MarR family transcriptional regulator